MLQQLHGFWRFGGALLLCRDWSPTFPHSQELLCGPMLKDRARIVVLQPESVSWSKKFLHFAGCWRVSSRDEKLKQLRRGRRGRCALRKGCASSTESMYPGWADWDFLDFQAVKPSRGDLKRTHRDQWNSYPGGVDRICAHSAWQVTKEYNQYHYTCLSSARRWHGWCT